MALPKLEAPIYELELPSTGEKIKYRPFLVKEQKTLMIANESEDDKQIQNALASIVSECTFGAVDPHEVPMFDIEFLFLRIRGKSVGETVTLNVLCPDDEKTRVEVKVNLEDIQVQLTATHTNEVSINDNIKVFMRYPTLNDMTDIVGTNNVEDIFTMVKRCINEVHDGENIYHKIDMSDKELDEFILNLPSKIFEQLGEFFETMPKVLHVMKVKNPKTKKTGEVVIEGIQSFFE
jgi:hypothetical protein